MPMGGPAPMLMSAPMPYPSGQALPGGALAAPAADAMLQARACTPAVCGPWLRSRAVCRVQGHALGVQPDVARE
jgi:hypothetical protein